VNVRYGIPFEAGRVTNLLARQRGTAPEEASAVLLVAHYDSLPGSPGAADNALGVAALLETVRALKAGPELKGDVLLLFTDAEEGGLLGIQSFIRQHLGRERVGFVLNLDARGVRGPALLVSAAGPVGALVSGAMRAAEALDAGSLQHAGALATALARWFATHPVGVSGPPRGRETFFTLGPWLVRYPASVSIALALLAAALAFAAYRMGARRGRWSAHPWLRALPWALVLPAACAALGVAAWWVLSRVHPSLVTSPRAEPYEPAPFRAGLLLLCVALAAGLARRLSPEGRMWAGPPAAAVLVLLLSLRAAEAGYLLALPLLAQAGAALWHARADRTELASALMDAAVLAVTVCLWAPFLLGPERGHAGAVVDDEVAILLHPGREPIRVPGPCRPQGPLAVPVMDQVPVPLHDEREPPIARGDALADLERLPRQERGGVDGPDADALFSQAGLALSSTSCWRIRPTWSFGLNLSVCRLDLIRLHFNGYQLVRKTTLRRKLHPYCANRDSVPVIIPNQDQPC
jgi:hypothetical protein